MPRKRRGPMAKDIDNLCVRLCLGNGTEAEFKETLTGIIRQYGGPRSATLGNIGRALQRSIVEYCRDKMDYIWMLADDVEPKIRGAWERY